MTTTRFAKLASFALAATIALPVVAGAVNLPDFGPIPAARPAADAVSSIAAAPQPQREVIHISKVAQDLPEGRRDVRVVGARFLPDAGDEIDFASHARSESAAVGYAEWFVMTAVSRMFETSEDTNELQIASN